MAITDAVKQGALQSLERAHRVRSARLANRLRIFNSSLDTWKELWLKLKKMPFVSFADPLAFDAETAEAFVENADATVAELAGVARERVVVIDVIQIEDTRSISASLGEGPEAPALLALVDVVGGAARLLPLGSDQAWQRGADGGLRLRSRRVAAPESGLTQSGA